MFYWSGWLARRDWKLSNSVNNRIYTFIVYEYKHYIDWNMSNRTVIEIISLYTRISSSIQIGLPTYLDYL